jgi:hypothetical protein
MTNKAATSLATLSLLLLALPSALAHPQSFAPSASAQAAALAALTGFVLTVAAAVSISTLGILALSLPTHSSPSPRTSLLSASRWRLVRLLCWPHS